MARVPGRDNRVAIPALVLTAAAVAALVWFAIPGMPMVVSWASGAVAGASGILASSPTPDVIVADTLDVSAADCRELYPNDLWNELTWAGGVILAQSTEPPATATVGLVEALTPAASRTCRWTSETSGAIVTTYATVAPEAAAVAEASLRGQGFTCESADGVLTCSGSIEGVVENHSLRASLWVVTASTGWTIEGYDERIRTFLWE